MFIVLLSLSLIVSLLAWAYASLAHFQKVLPFGHRDNILILTAHPDDECMFFGPTITSLRTLTKARISVLCLSTGNADGLGSIRKRELVKSCHIFGIPASNVKSLDHPQLQDGMQQSWDAQLISATIKDYVTKQKINTIITFDGQGVSSHPNHIAVYHGAKTFVQQCSSNIKLYRLVSISLIRKYIGVLDLCFGAAGNSIQLISPPLAYLSTHKAMRQHTSQLVWFRWLYVTFSRYMYINDLVQEQTV